MGGIWKFFERASLVSAVIVAVMPAQAATIFNGSVDAGRVDYANNCTSCHGTPPNNLVLPSVLNGANNPTLILNEIRQHQSMQFLASLSNTMINDIAVYIAKPTTTDADRIFNWGQATYPTLLTPVTTSEVAAGYYYRFYFTTNFYVGIKNGELFDLDGNTGTLGDLGPVSQWLSSAISAGF